MPLRRALLLAALLALPGLCSADDRFEALRAQAESLDSLPGFVARYVGSCKDPVERQACLENVKAARKAMDGKLYATLLSERVREILKVERRGAAFRFLLTPFVDADGLALTHGEPRLDARGRPTIGFLILDSRPGVDEAAVDAALRTGRIELEVIFRPEAAYRLGGKKADRDYEGVKARFAAVRLVDGRTGAEIAVKFP
jgi:hypothetical protein